MQAKISKPELEQFITEQVRDGHYPSPDAAVEAAIERMMQDLTEDDLDDETVAAINRAEEQLGRGEGIDFAEFAAQMRQRFGAK